MAKTLSIKIRYVNEVLFEKTKYYIVFDLAKNILKNSTVIVLSPLKSLIAAGPVERIRVI